MKKAKIFLTALSVLAVVGGVLAFKAKTPKEFAKCDVLASKLCILSTTTLFSSTVPTTEGTKIEYNEFGKPCVFDTQINTWTCTTNVNPAG